MLVVQEGNVYEAEAAVEDESRTAYKSTQQDVAPEKSVTGMQEVTMYALMDAEVREQRAERAFNKRMTTATKG